MWNAIYVFGDHAYRGRRALERNEHVPADEAEVVRTFGLPPRYVYRVEGEDFYGLTSDPVQVRRWTHRHPDAEVTIIPVH